MTLRKTPIERYHPEIWDADHQQIIGSTIQSREQLQALPFFKEPYENALSIDRNSDNTFSKFKPAIPEPLSQLHPQPPSQQHTLSQQGLYLLGYKEPLDFFDAIYGPHQIESLLLQTILYRNQKGLQNWKSPSYNEMRCFIGLLLWTSLVQLPNRRAYFTNTEIYHLPHFTAHTSRDRFEQLLTMLHFADNENIPQDLGTARRFEEKLADQLTAVSHNSAKLLTPSKALSIDEMMVRFYGRSVLRQYMPAKPNKYGVKLWAICCACCGYSLTQNIYLGSSVQTVGGRDVVLQLSEPYFEKGHVIYCDRFFSHLDLAAYLRSRQTGMVGTADITSLEPDLKYLVNNMHSLTWAYKWYKYKANFKFRTMQGQEEKPQAEESVCLLVWMDKKYRTTNKQVVFITNCIPAIPTDPEHQCHRKNIRDENGNYSRKLIASPPIDKAYNYRMGGVDRHDRLVGQHVIPLTSKRGYIKIFFNILDSAMVNAWILFKTAKQANGQWNTAAQRRHTLAWFKESVILSLCGNYTSRKMKASTKLSNPVLPIQSLAEIVQHQIQPTKAIPELEGKEVGRCLTCKKPQRTACIICKQHYCYECGRQHLLDLLKHHTKDMMESEEEQVTMPPPSQTST